MGWTGDSGYFERQTPSTEQALGFYISDQRQQEFLQSQTDNCTDVSACKGMKVKVSQEELGSPFDKSIIQIVYTIAGLTLNDRMSQSQPYWKSIVIETRPGMYRELLLLKNEEGFWNGPPKTAEILNAGAAQLLVSNDSTTSRDMWCTGEFWVLGQSGATLADFSEVEKSIDKLVPKGAQAITPMCAAVNPRTLEVRSDIQKVNPECTACDVLGNVVVKFKFEGQRAVPVSANLLHTKP
jgi:hypothetical protein